ncbi:mitochondrial carrier protein [Coccidioides posadasii str. Silveira]|uniref:Mitochondrial thiamine pyrophosphate carrier 1 n=1 Tax=Coccidioides posadasii (strain RMSCC 757 / Silveira) TaxID=443226 RepID=E9D765_COCPS|nr:mitochondrial carrier protein [Coccidioides posadasii str. Silveira]
MGVKSIMFQNQKNHQQQSKFGLYHTKRPSWRRRRLCCEPHHPSHQELIADVRVPQAKTIAAPLERVKILFQTSHSHFVQHSTHWNGLFKAARDIQKTYGIPALFKGHSATLVRIFPYASINFLAYEQLRAVIIVSPEKETPSRRFLCGSIAGAASTFVMYPLELIRTRLAFETVQKSPSSWLGISQQMYYEGGGSWCLANFYRGFAPTMLGILPYAGMSFLAHDVIKDWFRLPALAPYTVKPQSHTQLTAVAQLFCGALAGMVAQTISYPIEIIRRRMHVGNVVGTQAGILETARRIFLERGARGFYVGLTIGYVKIAPMVATSFYVYDCMKQFLGLLEQPRSCFSVSQLR